MFVRAGVADSCPRCDAESRRSPDEAIDLVAARQESIDEVMPLVAAKKPSGSSDCSNVADMRRNRPLIDDDALVRLVTEPRRFSELGDSGLTLASSSRDGNASVLSGADVILA